MKVQDIMNEVAVIKKDIKLIEIAKIFADENISSLVLIQRKRLKGIVTERDVVRNIESLNKKFTDVMTKDVITILPNKDLDEAAEIMRINGVKRLLVADKDDTLVGIVTVTDLIANADMLNSSASFF